MRMRIKIHDTIHTAVSMLEQIGTKKSDWLFLPGEDIYRTTEGYIERKSAKNEHINRTFVQVIM